MAVEVLVLGGGYAGVIAANRLAAAKATPVHVTLVNRAPRFVERIRLHQFSAGSRADVGLDFSTLLHPDVDVIVGEATRITVNDQALKLRDGRVLAFDYLLYAAGSGATALPERAYTVVNVDDAAALRTRLPTLPPGATVAVIGGGLTGIETAAEIGRQYPHLDVTLQTDGAVGPGLSQGGRLQVRRSLAKLGVAVVEWSSAGADAAAAADVVVWCGGFKVTSLATDSGLPVDEHGRLRVDATLRARGLNNVFGAGDAAVVDEPGYAFIRMSCAAALPMGRHAGDNILRAARHQVLKPFTTMYVGQCISLGRGNAVLQVVRADDTPRQMSFTGPLAGMAKEGICKLTVVGMRREAGPALQTGSRISLPFREGERAAV